MASELRVGGLCDGRLSARMPASLLLGRRQGLGLQLPGQSSSCVGHSSSLLTVSLLRSRPASTVCLKIVQVSISKARPITSSPGGFKGRAWTGRGLGE